MGLACQIASGLTSAPVASRQQPLGPAGSVSPPSSLPMLLRKEVIQPHLPVRLPCYDFTPIADPTFDGSLPQGLGHRLRVLPTFVTSRAVCTRPGHVFTATLLIRGY